MKDPRDTFGTLSRDGHGDHGDAREHRADMHQKPPSTLQ